MLKRTYAIRYAAGQPVKQIFSGTINQSLPIATALPTVGVLRVMVWNIFKQRRSNWLSVLKSYGKDTQLLLLQEAHTTPELVSFAIANYLVTDQVPALVLRQYPSGVMTLSVVYPVYCYPFIEREPLLRLAKSALITVYPLLNGQLLMVVNIHAVNFSLGIEVYSRQLWPIGAQIIDHHGPVIMAGDFNAWNRKRINALYEFAGGMALREVSFLDDHRRKAFGRPLDYVFYRDLQMVKSSVLETSASDHNPLLVEFHSEPVSDRVHA
ncbi:hypothetical protein SCc_233 [Serratia symbiotica str. 'Cinara cedri']|nr:hypothetical protein SCc_233 [Serratia symbiotica str. 'Cinara cedri']